MIHIFRAILHKLGIEKSTMSAAVRAPKYTKMNVWLHQTVSQKFAENGGNIPQSLPQ